MIFSRYKTYYSSRSSNNQTSNATDDADMNYDSLPVDECFLMIKCVILSKFIVLLYCIYICIYRLTLDLEGLVLTRPFPENTAMGLLDEI